jgi:hypothetical protein
LCDRFGIECRLPEEFFPAGVKKEDAASLNKERERILGELFRKQGVSIWDVFDESGIG